MGQLRLVTSKTGRSQFIPLRAALRDYLATLEDGEDPRACLIPRAVAAVDANGGKTGTLSNQFANILAAAGLRGENLRWLARMASDARRSTPAPGSGTGRPVTSWIHGR